MLKKIKFKPLSKFDIILLAVLTIVIAAYFIAKPALLITTGRYGQGKIEDNKLVSSILGEEYAEERFELYFQWYNVLHELGHGIIFSNSKSKSEPVDEEQLANDFAVAFWTYYGEEEKLNKLELIVSNALENLDRPVDENTSHMDYAKKNWGKKELYTFENYGWFQFSCVSSSLNERDTLESVLIKMGVNNIEKQPRKTFVYQTIGEDTVVKIIEDAVAELHKWGAEIPNVYHTFSNDPNNNKCQKIKNVFGVLDILHNKVISE